MSGPACNVFERLLSQQPLDRLACDLFCWIPPFIVGSETLSWSQAGSEDFILLNKYMLQGLSCSSYMIKLHPGMYFGMNPRNDVKNHGYDIWSDAILRPDFILRDQDRK